jgi:hypothetical protein
VSVGAVSLEVVSANAPAVSVLAVSVLAVSMLAGCVVAMGVTLVPDPPAPEVCGSGVWQAARRRPETAIIGTVKREGMTAWPDKGMRTGTAAP